MFYAWPYQWAIRLFIVHILPRIGQKFSSTALMNYMRLLALSRYNSWVHFIKKYILLQSKRQHFFSPFYDLQFLNPVK